MCPQASKCLINGTCKCILHIWNNWKYSINSSKLRILFPSILTEGTIFLGVNIHQNIAKGSPIHPIHQKHGCEQLQNRCQTQTQPQWWVNVKNNCPNNTSLEQNLTSHDVWLSGLNLGHFCVRLPDTVWKMTNFGHFFKTSVHFCQVWYYFLAIVSSLMLLFGNIFKF